MTGIEKALPQNLKTVSQILKDAKEYQRKNGNNQWNQPGGYPNEETLKDDINKQQLYIYIKENKIIGFFVLLEEQEHDYDKIDGEWLTNGKYATIHRICIAKNEHNKGMGKEMIIKGCKLAKEKGFKSVRIDTHKNNLPMQKTLEKIGFKKCGIIKIEKNLTDPLREAYEMEI